MIRPLYLYGSKVLQEPCVDVDPTSSDTISLVEDLKDTLEHYRGYGMSAPQIGVSKRVFVFHRAVEEEATGPIIVMINPVLIGRDGGAQKGPEGCISFPNYYVTKVRPNLVGVEWSDFRESKSETFVTLECRIICHENDHLDGKLITGEVSLGKRKQLKRRYKKLYNQVVYPKEEETNAEV